MVIRVYFSRFGIPSQRYFHAIIAYLHISDSKVGIRVAWVGARLVFLPGLIAVSVFVYPIGCFEFLIR